MRPNVLFRRVVPGVLLVLTLGTALLTGVALTSTGDSAPSVWRVLGFAACALLGVGAHAFGHYVVARRYNVDAWFPCFVPQVGFFGTSGAYVKLHWPIADRRALIRIFAAGPIAGFAVSAVLLFVGMALSTTGPRPSGSFLEFGDSLLTLAAQHLFFPALREGEEVLVHPLVMTAYGGLTFGMWQLLPAGRFDAGRVMYALVGYRRALIVSWLTIAILVALSVTWAGWLSLAGFAALTLIRITRQHPPEGYTQELDSVTIALACAMLAILVVTFVPVPIRVGS
jgi:membrane-associated protease RseP (regulator of RpoE activity)